MQLLENHIRNNFENWQKVAEKYTRSKLNGEYLLSDIVTSLLERPEIGERMCVEGYIDRYVRMVLWKRKAEHHKSRIIELTGDIAIDEPEYSPIDNELMHLHIDLVVSQLPMIDRELIRAYKLGVKPTEISEAMGVEIKETYARTEVALRKIKRRVKIIEP